MRYNFDADRPVVSIIKRKSWLPLLRRLSDTVTSWRCTVGLETKHQFLTIALKCKAVPPHATEALGGGRRYSSYSFSTSALNGGEWSASHPDRALPPGKGPPVPIVQEAGWVLEPVWAQRLEEKFFRLCRGSNLHRPVVQPIQRLSYPALTMALQAVKFRFPPSALFYTLQKIKSIVVRCY
jgi:hypothetical protein